MSSTLIIAGPDIRDAQEGERSQRVQDTDKFASESSIQQFALKRDDVFCRYLYIVHLGILALHYNSSFSSIVI